MSTASKDVSYDVISAIYTALGGDSKFTSSIGSIPIYKSIPKDAALVYIKIGEVVDTEEGTKDSFMFRGSVPVIVCDESHLNQADKKKAQTICSEVRATLKPSRASVPSGFIQFNANGKTEYVDLSVQDRPKIRIVDIYEFIIE